MITAVRVAFSGASTSAAGKPVDKSVIGKVDIEPQVGDRMRSVPGEDAGAWGERLPTRRTGFRTERCGGQRRAILLQTGFDLGRVDHRECVAQCSESPTAHGSRPTLSSVSIEFPSGRSSWGHASRVGVGQPTKSDSNAPSSSRARTAPTNRPASAPSMTR